MRILFSGVPAFGHLLPFAPLAREARAAGHEVALLTSGGMTEAIAADLPGVQLVPAGPMPAALFAEVGRRTGVADAAANPQPEAVAEFFAGVRVDLTADEAVAAARDWAPDLMICEATDFVGPLVASTLRVPWHMLALGPAVPPEFTAPMFALVAQRYAGRGLTPTMPGSYIDPVPSALQTPGFAPRARHLPVRAEARQRPAGSVDAGHEAARREHRRVQITLGTVFSDPDLLTTIIRSLDTTELDVVATLGVTGIAAPAIAGVDYRTFAHLAELLDVEVVLCAGGSGTVLGALSRGIPLVVLPQGDDQPLNAARTEAAGVAVVISDPQDAGAATRRVLNDPSFATAAHHLARSQSRQPPRTSSPPSSRTTLPPRWRTEVRRPTADDATRVEKSGRTRVDRFRHAGRSAARTCRDHRAEVPAAESLAAQPAAAWPGRPVPAAQPDVFPRVRPAWSAGGSDRPRSQPAMGGRTGPIPPRYGEVSAVVRRHSARTSGGGPHVRDRP